MAPCCSFTKVLLELIPAAPLFLPGWLHETARLSGNWCSLTTTIGREGFGHVQLRRRVPARALAGSISFLLPSKYSRDNDFRASSPALLQSTRPSALDHVQACFCNLELVAVLLHCGKALEGTYSKPLSQGVSLTRPASPQLPRVCRKSGTSPRQKFDDRRPLHSRHVWYACS